MAQPAEDPSDKPSRVGERTALGWINDGVMALHDGFGLVILGGAAAAFATVATAPHDQFLAYWILWLVALVATMAGGIYGLRFLRRQRFGNVPPSSPVSRLDVLQSLAGLLAAGGGILICVPSLLKGEDKRTWSVATALCALALFFVVRDAVHYVTRR